MNGLRTEDAAHCTDCEAPSGNVIVIFLFDFTRQTVLILHSITILSWHVWTTRERQGKTNYAYISTIQRYAMICKQ